MNKRAMATEGTAVPAVAGSTGFWCALRVEKGYKRRRRAVNGEEGLLPETDAVRMFFYGNRWILFCHGGLIGLGTASCGIQLQGICVELSTDRISIEI